MADVLSRIFGDLLDRVQGPMHFRVFLQPTMAIIFAVRDGMRDAREGRAFYSKSLFTQRGQRMELVRQGAKSVGKVFILAVVLEVVYQVWQLHTFYPGEALLVALILAIVPYLLLRGTVNRFMSRKHRKSNYDNT